MLWLDIYRLDHIRQGKVAALNSLATDLGIDMGSHLRNRWKLGCIYYSGRLHSCANLCKGYF